MRPTLRENLATLRPIRNVLIAVAVARSSVMLFPFYGAYLAVTRDELSPAAVGLVIGAFGVGGLAADLVVGRLTRRWPEHRVAVGGLAGVAGAVLVVAVAPGLWPLVAMTGVWGFCYELLNPISYTMVARTVSASQRRFAFAAVRLAVNVGMGVGPVIAGLLFPVAPHLLVWGTAAGYLAAAAILVRHRPAGADEEAPAETPEDRDDPRDGLRFWSFFAAIMPIQLAYALPPTVMSVYVIQHLGWSPIWVSAVFATNSLMVITCELGLNHVMNHWRRRTTLLTGYACAVAGFALMGFGGSPWLLLAGTVGWTLGEMITFPAMPDHITAVSPARLRARNIGLYAAGFNIGLLVAPLLFLPLLAVAGAGTSWSVVAGVVALGMIAVAVLSSVRILWTRKSTTQSEVIPTA